MLDLADWEQFKIERTDGETEHWRIRHFSVQENAPSRLGHIADGRDTGAGTFTRLDFRKGYEKFELTHNEQYLVERGHPIGEWTTMMSDTMAEITDHYLFLDKVAAAAHFRQPQRVLITGLGLGMVAEACLTLGDDVLVDVVEFDQEVIDLIAPQLARHGNRLRIIHADAYTWVPDTHYDLAWHDIWPYLGSDNLTQMRAMKRHYRKYVTSWQGCWGWEHCLYMRRAQRTDPLELIRSEKRHARLFGEQVPQETWDQLGDHVRISHNAAVLTLAGQHVEAEALRVRELEELAARMHETARRKILKARLGALREQTVMREQTATR